MRRIEQFSLVLILTILAAVPASARVIRVPQDRATIQAGVSAAGVGDTVMVADGNYSGQGNTRVSITNRMVVMSENGPRSCTIDGQRADSVYIFDLAANGAQIRGFTITRAMDHCIKALGSRTDWMIRNCSFVRNQNDADRRVGIRVEGGTGTILECIFQENLTNLSGGCIFITGSSRVTVNSCLFMDNTASLGGGIIVTQSSTPEIRNCFFQGNTAVQHGGAICVSVSSNPTINFCTFIGNTSNGYGGAVYKGSNSTPVVRNCVFWGNQGQWGNNLGAEQNGGAINIAWCSVEGGIEEGGGWNGDPIFEIEPRFVQSQAPIIWGIDGLFLNPQCGLINRGSAPARNFGMDTMTTQVDRSFDADTVDIGFHYDPDNFARIGFLSGRVVDAETNRGIEGVEITTSRRQLTETNRNGAYIFEEALAGQFDITASLFGYNDSTLTEQFLEEGGELEINFALLHPECILSRNRIESTVWLGDSATVSFNLENTGNGPLVWSTQTRLVGAANVDPWELRVRHAAGNQVNDTQLQGIAFVDSLFYVIGRNEDAPTIYRFNREGALVDTFAQPGFVENGINDITWDGQLLWGLAADTVYGFTTEGILQTQFPIHFRPATSIAWDPDREIFWISGTTTNICTYNRNGERQALNRERRNLRIYGLSYWPDNANGLNLFLEIQNLGTTFVYAMNPETGDTLRLATLGDSLRALGSHITNKIDPFSVNFLTIRNEAPAAGGDAILVYQLASNTAWMQITPREGTLQARERLDFTFKLLALEFPRGVYQGQLVFSHNAVPATPPLPVIMRVDRNFINGDKPPEIPGQFILTGVHPNPFNAETTVEFSIPSASRVDVIVYDLAGRSILQETTGLRPAGRQSLSLDASAWPSGIYIARLEVMGKAHSIKLACVK